MKLEESGDEIGEEESTSEKSANSVVGKSPFTHAYFTYSDGTKQSVTSYQKMQLA